MPIKRKPGYPRQGHAVFTKKEISKLPEEGRMREVARILGVNLGTIQQWVSVQVNPLIVTKFKPRGSKRNYVIIKREELIQWLIKTKRYVEEDAALN